MRQNLLKLIIITLSLWSVSSKGSSFTRQHFPQGEYVSSQVNFWYKIFNNYNSYQTVIHDSIYPEIIIDVIDFKVFAKRYNKGIPYSYKTMNEITEKYKKRYYQASERFKLYGKKAIEYGLIERRLYETYSKNPVFRARLFSGKIKIRGQAGLREEFISASNRSLKYIDQMEKIFESHGIPKSLTRIAFVESMFNEKAVSKVGASGIWQFMPSTAKDFLIVNDHIDERNSPIKATEAAAKLLKANYRLLKTWPLAVTAYNYGAGGLLKAIRKHSTRDWNVIATNHKSKTFGFASRNFYAEFVAAMFTYEKKFSRPKLAEINNQTTKLKLPKNFRLKDIYKKLRISKKVLKNIIHA